MKKTTAISCAFLDIGGVLLDRWLDHLAADERRRDIKLEWAEMEDYHHLAFKIYEEERSRSSFNADYGFLAGITAYPRVPFRVVWRAAWANCFQWRSLRQEDRSF